MSNRGIRYNDLILAGTTLVLHPSAKLRNIPKDAMMGDERYIKRMIALMIASNGIGLAATQCNVPRQICVIAPPGQKAYVMLNPEILERSEETYISTEGCLSLPEQKFEIIRNKNVKIKYLTPYEWKPVYKTVEGLEAAIIQHELDHLNGVLLIDNGKTTD